MKAGSVNGGRGGVASLGGIASWLIVVLSCALFLLYVFEHRSLAREGSDSGLDRATFSRADRNPGR